jgi:hypothetical protein
MRSQWFQLSLVIVLILVFLSLITVSIEVNPLVGSNYGALGKSLFATFQKGAAPLALANAIVGFFGFVFSLWYMCYSQCYSSSTKIGKFQLDKSFRSKYLLYKVNTIGKYFVAACFLKLHVLIPVSLFATKSVVDTWLSLFLTLLLTYLPEVLSSACLLGVLFLLIFPISTALESSLNEQAETPRRARRRSTKRSKSSSGGNTANLTLNKMPSAKISAPVPSRSRLMTANVMIGSGLNLDVRPADDTKHTQQVLPVKR